MNTLPDDYTPQVSTKPVDPSIEGSGYYLLIDDVIVDQSWKEVDLFDEHAKAILSEPHRAFLWRESARVLNSLPRKPLRERRIDWCEMGQHQMQPSQSYCYSWLNIRACKECTDKHIETYFPKRDKSRLVENTLPAESDCSWCDAKVGETHSRSCPNGERYKQVQRLTQSGKSLPEIIPGYIEQAFPESAAAELGRRGGKVKSEAKSSASRANGSKGGRPKSTKSIDMEDI